MPLLSLVSSFVCVCIETKRGRMACRSTIGREEVPIRRGLGGVAIGVQ